MRKDAFITASKTFRLSIDDVDQGKLFKALNRVFEFVIKIEKIPYRITYRLYKVKA